MGIFSQWVESLDYQYEITSSCSRHKSPRSKCSNCAESCDYNAITFEKGLPVINHGDCKECGKCIPACPVQAVAGIFPKRNVFQNYLVASGDNVPSVKELLVYARKGIQGIINDEEIKAEWLKAIEETNAIMEKLGQGRLQVVVRKLDKGEVTYTRRDLFFSWKKDTQSWMKEMAPAKWRFNQKDLELSAYYPNHQFAEIHLDIGKCTLCRACQHLCDKKCLQITENGFEISHQSCSSCRLCEDICPEQAIIISEIISPSYRETYPYHRKKCPTCREEFNTLNEKDETCVPCTKRSKLFKPF